MIYEISYKETNDLFIFKITESNIIEDIYINNNVWIKDDLIIQNLISKKNNFLTKNKIQKDIKIIKNFYKSKGLKIFLLLLKLRNIHLIE